jgi:hypothetical protein
VGNGVCAINSARYSGFFSTIASHGFLVLSTVPEPGAARRQQNADDMRAEIDWAAKENAREIVFYGAWGTPSARNKIIAIPTIAQGYAGRAKLGVTRVNWPTYGLVRMSSRTAAARAIVRSPPDPESRR